jgi:signal peptidase I
LTQTNRPAARPIAARSRPAQQLGAFVKELLFVVVGAIIVSSLLRAFVGQMFIIPSQSMENTLLVGDRVVVEKITGFQRGDVVVFADPGDWLAGEEVPERGPIGKALEFIGVLPDTSTEHLIKRVIGMPGDRVVCCDSKGRISVNGYPLDEAGYLYSSPDGEKMNPSDVRFEVVVPRDRIFVMGDHRSLSADSRCHLADLSQPRGKVAFVPIKLVVGPAVAIAAPFGRTTILHRPAVFGGVPAAKNPAPAEAVIKPEGVSC